MSAPEEKKRIGKDDACWFRVVASERFGPYSLVELREMWRRKEISGEDLVTRQRSNGEWVSLSIAEVAGREPTHVRRVTTHGKPSRSRVSPSKRREKSRHPAEDNASALDTLLQDLERQGKRLRKAIQQHPGYALWLKARQKWITVVIPLIMQNRLLFGAATAVLFLLMVAFLWPRGRLESGARYSKSTAPIQAAPIQAAPAAKGGETKARGALSGCPKTVNSGLGLARAATELLTLQRVTLEEAPTGCPPCAIRARLPDGAPLALEWKGPLPSGARAGTTLSVCGRITARTSQRIWIRVEKSGEAIR